MRLAFPTPFFTPISTSPLHSSLVSRQHRTLQTHCSMTAITYITSAHLVSKLRAKAPIIIVDVRDEDREGGHIKTSLHIPSSQFKMTAASHLQAWKGREAVIFHCMMSQMRGPSCARRFADIIEVEMNKNPSTKEEGNMPKVQILEGGFQEFARLYSKENEDVFENVDPLMYATAWERD